MSSSTATIIFLDVCNCFSYLQLSLHICTCSIPHHIFPTNAEATHTSLVGVASKTGTQSRKRHGCFNNLNRKYFLYASAPSEAGLSSDCHSSKKKILCSNTVFIS